MSSVESDFKIAVSSDSAGTDHIASWIFDSDGGTRLAFARERQTIVAHSQIGRSIWSSSVARDHVDRWRGQPTWAGQGYAQGFTVRLCGAQGDVKVAVITDGAGADHIARRVFDRNGGARLTFAGYRQAVSADNQTGGRLRRNRFAHNYWRRRRDVACLVGQGNFKGGAIALSGVQGDFEAAISPHDRRTDLLTGCVFNNNRAARFTFTGERQAIGADSDIGWRIGSGGVTGYHATDLRDVTRLVSQGDAQGFAVGLSCFESDREGAICTDCPSANHIASWIFDSDGGTRLAFTRERQTIVAHSQIRWRFRCGGIARDHADRWRGQATRAGQGYAQSFAVGLCGAEGDIEVAVITDSTGADHIARRVFDRHGGARLTFTGYRQAISADNQTGWRFRRYSFTHNYWRGCRNISGLVSQGHFKGGAIALGRIQGDFETAISPHNRRTDLLTVGVFNDNRAARFTLTGKGQAVGTYSQIGWRIRRGGVGVHNAADWRYLAFAVSQRDIHAGAAGQGRVEGQVEIAIGIHRPAADNIARRILDRNLVIGLPLAADREAVLADDQVSGRERLAS